MKTLKRLIRWCCAHSISHARPKGQLPTTTDMDSQGSASSPVITLVLDHALPLLKKGQKWALPQLEQVSAKSLDMLARHPAASLWTAGLMLLVLAALVLTVAVAVVLFCIFLAFSLILSGLIGQYSQANATCTAGAQTSSELLIRRILLLELSDSLLDTTAALDGARTEPRATKITTVKSAAATSSNPDKLAAADASTAPNPTSDSSWYAFCAAVAYQRVVKPRTVLFWFAK